MGYIVESGTRAAEKLSGQETNGRQVHVDTGLVLSHLARMLTELGDGEDPRDTKNFKT